MRAISEITFTETFSEFNSDENMRIYIRENLTIEKLSSELNTPFSKFFSAQFKSDVVGYLKLNLPHQNSSSIHQNFVEIERIYILKHFKKNGLGTRLLEFTKDIDLKQKCSGIWLWVWEENYKAIAFYTKNRFEITGKHLFKLGKTVKRILLRNLNSNSFLYYSK